VDGSVYERTGGNILPGEIIAANDERLELPRRCAWTTQAIFNQPELAGFRTYLGLYVPNPLLLARATPVLAGLEPPA
jgi:hypothetical protein